MPTSSTNSWNSLALRQLADQIDPAYFDQYARTIQRAYGLESSPLTEDMRRMMERDITDQANAVRRARKWEKDALKKLLDTGITSDLTLAEQAGGLQVFGKNIADHGKLMFLLDDDKITVHNERSKHLLPLLKSLAKAEGLPMLVVDEYPSLEGNSHRVAFWAFKTIKQVDDTAIVMQSEPVDPIMREQVVFNEANYTYWDGTYSMRPPMQMMEADF